MSCRELWSKVNIEPCWQSLVCCKKKSLTGFKVHYARDLQSLYASLNIYAWVRHNSNPKAILGAATASGGRHAPLASFWERIMTSCMNIKRGVLLVLGPIYSPQSTQKCKTVRAKSSLFFCFCSILHFFWADWKREESFPLNLTSDYVHTALQIVNVSQDILRDNVRPLLMVSWIWQKWYENLLKMTRSTLKKELATEGKWKRKCRIKKLNIWKGCSIRNIYLILQFCGG